ncbi:Serine/Threonine kinase (macronuclear) [Tetrahymena thermophila SB210]|uniref:Serine/Threonine kinase n=1 Tax=Tetrahymena thermophila (strain SB210) TaxID=312017 RepID=Q23AE6_TETTS|nr:Serine/Threonine kinase [Tetrahymena thermophila SB210]EAR93546.4 Serine/Threonine kinase [Tetrahymena thermophila SB210]|eukprot:XP_001013791.4 Serine/Threonine kinase [Tetrahymena thermophila SB210]
MNLMYDMICRRPDNTPSESHGTTFKNNNKLKQKQGSSSSRKPNNISQSYRDKTSLLTPIDHGNIAKNIYLGQIRINPQQNTIQQQFLQNQQIQTKIFYRTLQKNGQAVLAQQNFFETEMTPNLSKSDLKNYSQKQQEYQIFGTFSDKMNSQVCTNINNNYDANYYSSNNQYNNNLNVSELAIQNQNSCSQQMQTSNQIDQLNNIQEEQNNQTIGQKEDQEAIQKGDLYSDVQNQEQLCQNSFNSNYNIGNNQFRISKSKNGLRTPKQVTQKQQQLSQQQQNQITIKDQAKSKSQQKSRGKKVLKNSTNLQQNQKQEKTFEMLKEAQNRLKMLQQNRFNNYNDLKQQSLYQKPHQNSLKQPLKEVQISTVENFSNDNFHLNLKQEQSQKIQKLPSCYVSAQNQNNQNQQVADSRKRGSCLAKLNTVDQDNSIEQSIQDPSQKNDQNRDLYQENYRKDQIQEFKRNQAQNIQKSSSNNNIPQNEEFPYESQAQISLNQLSTSNIKTSSNIENNFSHSSQHHLNQANSSNIDLQKNKNQTDQSRLLNCPRKPVYLSDEDKKIYGDRFLDGYQKLSLLGKGGFALVWLAKQYKTGISFAVKQICKQNGSDSHMREMRINQQFYDLEGEVKEYFHQFEGINNFLKCYEIRHTQRDIFIVYELGGGSLSSILYEIKGEFYKNERVYKINFTELHDKLFQTKSNNLLRSLMRHFFNALDLLQNQKIVHCDVKPENILVELDQSEASFQKVHLIDFGSCFSFKDVGSIGMATPEYLAPEMLELFAQRFNINNQVSQIEQLAKIANPWSVDMWSMGAVMLEVLTGLPHWLAYKCRVVDKQGKSNLKYGLFCTKGQDYEKIIQKQQQFCDNFSNNVKEITKQFDCQVTAKKFQDLLKKMMKFNSIERISPQQALQHPFFSQQNTIGDFCSTDN